MTTDESIRLEVSNKSICEFDSLGAEQEKALGLLSFAQNGSWRDIRALAVDGRIDSRVSHEGRNALVLALVCGDLDVLETLAPFFFDEPMGGGDDGWLFWAAGSSSDRVEPLVFLAGKNLPAPRRKRLPHPCHLSMSPAVWSWWAAYEWGKGGGDRLFAKGVGASMVELGGKPGLWERWADAISAKEGGGPPPSAKVARRARDWLRLPVPSSFGGCQ